MQVTTIGIDLAKNIFQVHGITESDEVAFNRPLRRTQVLRQHEFCIGAGRRAPTHAWRASRQHPA